MQVHNQATDAAKSTYNTLQAYMPKESAFITTIGGCQLYCSIWLTVFGYGFNPLLYTVGYLSAVSHIALGGLIRHKQMHSKIWWFFVIIMAIIAFASSIGIVYHLRADNSNWVIDLLNFYSIFVVTVWGGAIVYFIGVSISKSCAHHSRDILTAYPDSSIHNGLV